MLQSLILLSDSEIELVTEAVREWCRAHHRDIDSVEGRRALNVVVDLVQSKYAVECLVPLLTQRLAPLGDTSGELAL
ncbi:hypothetical protein ASC90_25175 [Rhizobium sp. Root1220]|nr:hypothetical protein [Rhizobium sp. Root1220]KQV80562.1 hypothetical protein ASC90_25175 [Rhizobium sp. Root1220]